MSCGGSHNEPVLDAAAAGVCQMVILAAGLDVRSWHGCIYQAGLSLISAMAAVVVADMGAVGRMF